MVEGEWREHGAISVNITLDEQCGSTNTVQVDDILGVATGICIFY